MNDWLPLVVIVPIAACRLVLEAAYWMIELWYRGGDWAVLAVGWYALIACLLLMWHVDRKRSRRLK